MDTSIYAEGQNLTVDLVRNSPTKRLCILGEGEARETEFGERFALPVEIDGKKKEWLLNRDSIRNMQQLGVDSKLWEGVTVNLQIVSINGRDSVIGIPVLAKVEEEKVSPS